MALPQIVTKTYSRRRSRHADVSHAERTFDELFRGTSRPPARAAATAEKWGSASFKRISNTPRTSPKRKLSPTRADGGDDPFSFDSDDDNIAKKSRKENVRQKTSPRKQTVGGESEKSRARIMNFKEKPSADSAVDKRQLTSRVDDGCAKPFIDKVTRCQPAVKSSESERNGMFNYRASESGSGDSVETNDRKCRSNGLESTAGDSKPYSPRTTRSSGTPSPCKTTEQLKVFVDNFSQLISSQRSAAASKRSERDSDISSGAVSSDAGLDSPVRKSKRSENCDRDLGHSRSSVLHRTARDSRRPVKTDTMDHGSKRHHNIDDDDDDDDDCVLLISPHGSSSADSTHRTGSRTCSRDTSSSRNSLPTKTSSGLPKNSSRPKCIADSSGKTSSKLAGSKSGQLRSHSRRCQTSASSADNTRPATTTTATTAASASATTTTTYTRRLLTGSQKVSSFLVEVCHS